MELKPEVIKILERERKIAGLAITQLENKCRSFEQLYGLVTDEFVNKFNTGEIGDDLDFFRWYAYVEAVKDWKMTQDSLTEVLTNSENAYVA
jgi:hypothetical protein